MSEKTPSEKTPRERLTESRVQTGIAGLDEILLGGLPSGQMYLVEGDPGTGKTTLAMQFILQGVARGERGLYITLSETKAELALAAASHGWQLDDVEILELAPHELTTEEGSQYTVFHPSEVEMVTTMRRMLEEVERTGPNLVVFDSISELRLLAGDVVRYRRQLLAMKNFFARREATVLILDDKTGEGNDKQLQSIAHGVLHLKKLPREYGATRRNVEVLKLRGSAYHEGYHDYTIKPDGLNVFPRLKASEHEREFPEAKLASDLAELDVLLGGGLQRGSSNLMIGPAGTGKSTIAALYAAAAARKGHRAVIYMFDELVRTLCGRCSRLGIDMDGPLATGKLTVEQIDPAELSPGEFAGKIVRLADEEDLRVVVIDSLNGFTHAMTGEEELLLHLHELLSSLNARGVTTIMTTVQHGMVGAMRGDVEVSYLADCVLMLRYFEAYGEVRQAVSVMKNRNSEHEHSIRELKFTEGAIVVGEPLKEYQGVLTGVPQFLVGQTANAGQNG